MVVGPVLDALLRGAALVVEGDNALSRPRQVGDDEADVRLQFARVPLDLSPQHGATFSSSAPDSGSWRSNGAPRSGGHPTGRFSR
jgi:hypothetical protein